MPSKQGPRLYWRLSNLTHPQADLDKTVHAHLLNHAIQVQLPYDTVNRDLQEELDVQLVTMLPPDEGYQVSPMNGCESYYAYDFLPCYNCHSNETMCHVTLKVIRASLADILAQVLNTAVILQEDTTLQVSPCIIPIALTFYV